MVKTIFYFLSTNEFSSCKIVVTRKSFNLEDRDGTQVSWQLIFTGLEKCITKLFKTIKYTCQKYTWLLFLPLTQPPSHSLELAEM